jgi:flagellar assembly protein FliH
MGAAPAKFLFDVDFSTPGSGHGGAQNNSQQTAAEARGYRLGFEAAQREATAQTERRIADASSDIAAALNMLAANFASTSARLEGEAVDIAVAVGRKLAGELLATEPLGEIVGLVNDCFRQLVATPHLVVRVNDGLYDACRARLEELAKHSGFQGKLVILADPDIAGGDCRIEWADGGVVLARRDVEARIADLVGRYMASRSTGRTTP